MDDDAKVESSEDGNINIDPTKIGNASCVTKFVKTLLSLVNSYSYVQISLFTACALSIFRWNMALKLI